MRKFILLAVICASLSLPLCTLFVVRASASVKSIYDVQLGMDMLDVLAGLQDKYSINSFDVEKGMRHYSITGGPDRHFRLRNHYRQWQGGIYLEERCKALFGRYVHRGNGTL